MTANPRNSRTSNREGGRPWIGAVLALLAVGVLMAHSAHAGDILEPNDTLATATATGLTGLGTVTIADVQLGDGAWAAMDVDIFAFEIGPGTLLPVLLTVELETGGSGLDGYLRLFDVFDAELANNNDRAFDDVDPQIRTYLLDPGVYYAGVSGSGNPHYDNITAGSGMPTGMGSYAITITLAAGVPPDSANEPNDTVDEATPVGGASVEILGQFIGDWGAGRPDVDIYEITLTGPARIDAEVRAEAVGSVLDPIVSVFGIVNDDRPDGSGDAAVSVSIPSNQASLPVYVWVAGAGSIHPWDDPIGDPRVRGSVGYYDLILTITYFDVSGPNEPNDSIMMAAPINMGPDGTGAASGLIGDGEYSHTRGDRDFFEVRAMDTGVLAVEVTPTDDSELQPVIAVYDYWGRRLAISRANINPASLHTPIRCSMPFDEDEEEEALLYIMVMGTKQRFPNDPFVPVGIRTIDWRYEAFAGGDGPGSTGAYSLTAYVLPGTCGSEPNDTMADAMETGIIDQGFYVCTDGAFGDGPCDEPPLGEPLSLDVDMWRVDVAGDRAVLEATLFGCQSYFEGRLRVFDDTGDEIISVAGWGSPPTIVELRADLDSPGAYYVAYSGHANSDYDPAVACSGDLAYVEPLYNITITLTPSSRQPYSAPAGGQSGGEPASLYATRLGAEGNLIDAIDPETGNVMATFSAPEAPIGGSEGLAFDGNALYYVGLGRYPKLYQLDGTTGNVLDNYNLWMGSGYYSDVTMLGGQLYILDFYENSLHVIDPVAGRHVRTLEVGLMNGITLAGGLAGLSAPTRLYAGDAFNTGNVYEVDPIFGTMIGTWSPPINRPTGLAGMGDSDRLYVADWQSELIDVMSRDGVSMTTLPLSTPIGSLAGKAFAGAIADCNHNDVADDQDLASNASEDCNGNGIPDECDIADGTSANCNANDIPDECEPDCNANGIQDDCDMAAGTSQDCNANYMPDDCETDCNTNGIADGCDLLTGTSLDLNANALPDECELVLFVDAAAPAGGEGVSWATAYRDLQDALTAARTSTFAYRRIRVAQGTYAPADPGGDRSATFQLPNGVAMHGGYAGSRDTNPNVRNIALYESVLNGDLNRDDGPDFVNNEDNCYHVVTMIGVDETTLLDGFTITAGRATGDFETESWTTRCGSGIFNDGGSPRIHRCTILDNHLWLVDIREQPRGAGMCTLNGNPTLTSCVFRGNGTGPFVQRDTGGGGVYNHGGSPTLIGCTFVGNYAGHGAAMFTAAGEPSLVNCLFVGNRAPRAGIIAALSSHAEIVNSVFAGNNCRHCLIVSGGSTRIVNGTIAGNTTFTTGRTIRCDNQSVDGSTTSACQITFINSILWNGGDEIDDNGGTATSVNHCDIAGGWDGSGGDNIDLAPQFVDIDGLDDILGTVDDNLRLLPGSPCIDAGDAIPLPIDELDLDGDGDTSEPIPLDLDDHARVLCGQVDIGAHEFGIGDYDCNRGINLLDFTHWAACMTGPGIGEYDVGCETFDFEFDGDVDIDDFALFQQEFSGTP